MILPVSWLLAQQPNPGTDAHADWTDAAMPLLWFVIALAVNVLGSLAQASIAAIGPAAIEQMNNAPGFLGRRVRSFLDHRRSVERQFWAANHFTMVLMLVLLSEMGRLVFETVPMLGPIIGIGLGILLHFLIIEVISRNLALSRPLALFPLFVPLAWLVTLPVQLVLWPASLLRGRDRFPSGSLMISDMELRLLPSLRGVDRIIDEEAFEMIDSVRDFAETTAEEIMTPRTQVEGIDSATDPGEIYEFLRSVESSRVIVFENDLDHVLGILLVKEILLQRPENPLSLIRKPVFASETARLPELLAKIRQNRTHLIVVLDEYGGTAGVVTLHDLFESIVGHIEDIEDGEELWIEKLPDGRFRLNGQVELWEVDEELGIALDGDSARTIGGYVFNHLGRVAVAGDSIESERCVITVESTDENRVQAVIVKLREDLPAVEGEGA